MKAVILIGGEATRLRPLTQNIPKAVVPVLNTPFLELVFRYLSRHGIRDIVLTQSRLLPIAGYFGDGSQFGIKIDYTNEDAPLGTAGAVKNAEKYLNEAFLVLNGDVLTDLDISAMVGFHRQKRAKVTIALTPVDDPTSYGLVETDDENRVTLFLEKPRPDQITTNLINAGIYVIEADVLARIPPRTSFSFERELFPQLLEQGEPVYAYPSSGYWIDIGTPQKYLQLNQDLLAGKARSQNYGLTPHIEVLLGDKTSLNPRAQIKGPTVIGSGCTIQEDALIEQSVIWQQVKIGRRAKVKNSIVANHCQLKDDCIIQDSVLGDNVTVTRGAKLAPGSKIEPGTTV
ncbi:MAG TPA: NDP-sugar synthase [Dehalococcoidales bacterium]|nr:NDP-sugar synthase [Dehalococcoidales bacterium]